MNSMDMTEILGTWQERYCVAMRAAKRLLHENTKIRGRLAKTEASETYLLERLADAEARADHVSFEHEVEMQQLEAKLAAARALLDENQQRQQILHLEECINELQHQFAAVEAENDELIQQIDDAGDGDTWRAACLRVTAELEISHQRFAAATSLLQTAERCSEAAADDRLALYAKLTVAEEKLVGFECNSELGRMRVERLETKLAAAEGRCASDHSGDGTDMTDKWATSLTESDVLNLRGIIAEMRDMPGNDRETFLLQALAKRIEEML